MKEKEGNCFARIYSEKNKTSDNILDVSIYNGTHNVDVLKGNKKLTEMVGKVDLEFPLIKIKESAYQYSNEKYGITIE